MLSAEWLKQDDVDLLGVSVPREINESATTMPIITIEEHLASTGLHQWVLILFVDIHMELALTHPHASS